MEILPLERTILIALMAAGLAFALCGVWLMLRPKPEGGAAKVELFGMKFESSSAGLLVFLIGSAFLATPLIVPERQDRLQATAGGGADVASIRSETAGSPSTSGTPAVVLPATAGAEEQEPNDFLTEANQIARGVFYAGQTNPDRNDREDWYVLPTPGLSNADVRFQVRTRAVSGVPAFCTVTVLDDRERDLKSWDFEAVGTSAYADVFVESSDYLLIRVFTSTGNYSCRYELKVH